jgi:hypothetical protein
LNPEKRERIRKGLEQYFATRYPGMDPADASLWVGYREMEWVRYFELYAEDRRNRISKTRALCPHKVWLVDLHSHSPYSDGRAANIAEVSHWAQRHAIDLQVVSDHDTIGQALDIQHFQNLALGEEVVSNDGHHIVGIEPHGPVDPDRNKPLPARMKDVRDAKGYAILAHPCGWRTTIYPPERVEAVFQMDRDFGMEIANGALNLFDYYDSTDADAMKLWDRLLCAGPRVIAFGNTDAHCVLEFGMVWNGFVGRKPTRKNLKRLCSSGRHFVSDGPFVFLRVNDVEMGKSCKAPQGKVKVAIEAYDSVGIAKVRVVKNGQVLKTLTNGEESGVLCACLDDSVGRGKSYYRVEVYATDFRKGFTNPVWVLR